MIRLLGTGALSSLLDHGTGLACKLLGMPTRAAALTGKTVGAVFSYFVHRKFTFTDHGESITKSGFKYIFCVVVISLMHAQGVVWLNDVWQCPYLVAAIVADLAIVTPSWMLALRFFVFPRAKKPATKNP
jgi:putative flippase GtrA